MVVRGRLDPPQLQDRWLADHADAGHRHRVLRRGGVPSSRPRGHLGTRDREAEEPRSGGRHRQGLRAGPQDRGGRAVAAGGGRRARRDAQQVRALRRSAVSGGRPPAGDPRRVLFVTGKLAEPALRRTLGEMAPPFAYDVAVMRITVAALMTTPWIARFLEVPPDTDLVLIPGLCEGDPAAIAAKARTRVEKGTKARVVAIPDFGTGLETLEPTVAALERWGVPHLIDPIIEPIGFGFMASLERFAETHRRYPAAPLFMGIGNITELTAADTTGVNALLVAICEEV